MDEGQLAWIRVADFGAWFGPWDAERLARELPEIEEMYPGIVVDVVEDSPLVRRRVDRDLSGLNDQLTED